MDVIGGIYMAYEIDFIGVSKDSVKVDADAIAIRWIENNDDVKNQKVIVYDGGLYAHGVKLKWLLNRAYFKDVPLPVIDAIIVSHSDDNHVTGLKELLKEFKVKALYMNRPWLFAEEFSRITIDTGNSTTEHVEKALKAKYPTIAEIEEIALENGIPIYKAFQGTIIEEKLNVLSPSEAFYKRLLIESCKPSEPDNESARLFKHIYSNILARSKGALEKWGIETLRENEPTSPNNNMSVVLLGNMEEESFFLTGDSGIEALNHAIEYAEQNLKFSLQEKIKFMQMPNHGDRHNISPSILDKIVGPIVKQGTYKNITVFASSAQESVCPYQMVVNAFVRRGCKVYKTNGNILWHHLNMPLRDGYHTAKQENFDIHVEEWED